MDDTTKSIVERIIVRFDEPREITPGYKTSLFYDCLQLTPNDLARLGAAAVGHLSQHHFDVAVGIAYAGVFYAAAIAGGRAAAILQKDGVIRGPNLKGKRVVVVSDVVRTGTEIFQAEEIIRKAGGFVVGYACIIDRSETGAVGSEDKPLWSAYRSPN